MLLKNGALSPASLVTTGGMVEVGASLAPI
ncbi:hypothetical protein DP62_5805 [Burkholderia pseudomallei]|nr:hypothetical protein DP62_5805 [Burkholderia pseudomallei]